MFQSARQPPRPSSGGSRDTVSLRSAAFRHLLEIRFQLPPLGIPLSRDGYRRPTPGVARPDACAIVLRALQRRTMHPQPPHTAPRTSPGARHEQRRIPRGLSSGRSEPSGSPTRPHLLELHEPAPPGRAGFGVGRVRLPLALRRRSARRPDTRGSLPPHAHRPPAVHAGARVWRGWIQTAANGHRRLAPAARGRMNGAGAFRSWGEDEWGS